MANHLTLSKAILAMIAITAILSMHNLAKLNGLFDHRPNFSLPDAVLPNTNIPVRQIHTGFPRLDEYLTFMISLFYVDLDPRNVMAHTQGLHFYGTLSAAWVLMVVEAHRSGHGNFFLLSTYLIEVVGELFGLGFWTPLWCLLHLSTSRTVLQNRSQKPTQQLFMSASDAAALPLALIIGFGVPTAVMFIGDPAGKLWSQQYWTLLRLIHPLFALILWRFFRLFTGNSNQSAWNAASTLRHFYTWAMMLSAICHLLSLGPVVLQYLCPTWLKPEVMAELEPFALLVPKPFWESPTKRIKSFAEGVSVFLVWDEFWTATAITTWALTLYHNGSTYVGKSDCWTKTKIVLQGLAWGIVAGPGAAAAFFVQERDNVVLDVADIGFKKLQ